MSQVMIALTASYVVLDFVAVLLLLMWLWDDHKKWAARYTLAAPITFPLTLVAVVLLGVPWMVRQAFPEPPLFWRRLLVAWHRWRDPEPTLGPTGEGAYRLSQPTKEDAP